MKILFRFPVKKNVNLLKFVINMKWILYKFESQKKVPKNVKVFFFFFNKLKVLGKGVCDDDDDGAERRYTWDWCVPYGDNWGRVLNCTWAWSGCHFDQWKLLCRVLWSWDGNFSLVPTKSVSNIINTDTCFSSFHTDQLLFYLSSLLFSCVIGLLS